MSKPPTDQPAPQHQEPGPTDVTLEEALEELTRVNGESGQQLAIARVKIRKQDALISQLQLELGKEVKEIP